MKILLKGKEFDCIINPSDIEIVHEAVLFITIIFFVSFKQRIISSSTISISLGLMIQSNSLPFNKKENISDKKIANIVMKKYKLANEMYKTVIDDISILIDKFAQDSVLTMQETVLRE